MLKWFVSRPVVVLFLVLAFLFVAGEGLRIIQYPPRSTHIFRQSDCLAYTKTYYQRNTGLFSPAAYNLLGAGGRVVSEFPLLYHITAKLCKLFGFHYWVIRGVTFLCYLLGLYYLFLTCRLWIKDLWLALFPVIILASSPFYFFYAVNFLPNVPAISFSFAGLYHMLLYHRRQGMKHVVAGMLYFVIATLLKPTDGGLIWMAYIAVALTSVISGKEDSDRQKIWPLLAGSVIVAAGIVLWYLFVKWYDVLNHNEINLQGVYPIWDMSGKEIADTFVLRIVTWERDIFHHIVLCMLLVALLVVYIVKWRRLDRFLRLFSLWLLIGALVYTPLWFKAFFIHDYYQLIYTIPAVFLCITVAEYWYRTVMPRMKKKAHYVVYTLLAGLMVVGIYHNQYIQLERYADRNRGVANPAIYEVEPYLRKIGISPADSVLSVPDGSPNISLAAFGNAGYTSDLFGAGHFSVSYCREHGIRYMIITDTAYIQDPAYEPYTTRPMGKYKGIYIYDIR